MALLKLIARLPFPALYLIADILYFLLWYVVKYRRNVILQNLENSFPEKTKAQHRHIARQFYRHIADVLVETLKTLTIPKEEIVKRVRIRNRELIEPFYHKGQSIIVVTSHQGNWEWLLVSCSAQLPFQVDAVYMELINPFFNKLMKKIRGRFGANLIEKKTSFREIVRRKDLTRIIAMVADQSSKETQHLYWTQFLHQDTGFYEGPERIAHKTGMPVIFVAMYRQKRGFYEIQFHTIDEPPFQTRPHFITEQYARAVETAIREVPAEWLWSHKRWKRKRQQPTFIPTER